MAEPIEIIIRKGTGGEGTGFGVPGANVSENYGGTNFSEEKKSNNLVPAKALALSLYSLGLLKREISFGITQYNNMTGNYIKNAQIEVAMHFLNTAVNTVQSAVIGGIITGGNPVGIMLGIASSVINEGINTTNQVISLYGNILKINTYANIMQERSGNVNNNGSRGTDY